MSYIQQYIDFLNSATGSPFAACEAIQNLLKSKGYIELHENQMWQLQPQSKYFVVRDQLSVVAFHTNKSTSTSKFICAGSHLDSPYLKLKPKASKVSEGLCMVNCEVYGGGIWNTWLDRDLGISGRVILDNGTSKVFTIKKPLLRIPGLAIHLDTERKYCINKENHLPAMCAEAKHKSTDAVELLLQKIKEEYHIEQNIIAHDIMLCDTQKAELMANGQFVVAQGQDNLNGAFTSLISFFNSAEKNIEKEQIDIYVAFDHEEIGSTSRRGAHSVFLPEMFKRIHISLFPEADEQTYHIALSKSVILSIDGAHASHPNMDFIESHHPIRLNGGVVLKNHCGQKYMSDALLRHYIKMAAGDVPTQIFVLRQNLVGGSTIGPHIAAFSGVTTIDMGVPMLSMHSIREMTGAKDVDYMIQLVEGCYTNFPDMI